MKQHVSIKDSNSLNFINCFNEVYNDYQLDKEVRKRNGIYFTNFSFAYVMIENFMDNYVIEDDISMYSFLEPCVGIGSFVFAYLIYVNENYKLSTEQKVNLIKNIYVCDNNPDILNTYKMLLKQFCQNVFLISFPKDYENNIGGALIYDLNKTKKFEKKSIDDIFKINHFDFIITNPPYKLLRAESKHYNNFSNYERDMQYYKKIKENSKNQFKFQGKGSLNIYKLFVEEILNKYVSDRGLVYLLIPQPFLKEQNAVTLRKEILLRHQLLHVINIDEDSEITSGNQSLTAVLISNQKLRTDSVEMINYYASEKETSVTLKHSHLVSNPDYKIIGHTQKEILFINKMNKYSKLKELNFIKNMRGELDVSVNKDFIGKQGEFNLVRGKNISKYFLKDFANTGEFVSNNFIKKTQKSKYIAKERIASPQITNMRSKNRLKFSFVPSNIILANSCNFIWVELNKYHIDIYYLLALFNSQYLDEYFKIFSSNNHINNHDIDNLPVPTNKILIKNLSHFSKLYIDTNDLSYVNKIDKELELFFKLENDQYYDCAKYLVSVFPNIALLNILSLLNREVSSKEFVKRNSLNNFDLKIIEGALTKHNKLLNKEILNNFYYSLSELDLEMVKSIPSGGNWKDIPSQIVEKSKRLQNISSKGGRTTLYGRLNYNKPSYTITTYFNRPGNGTNIHPKFDRVITAREAARLQTFPDDYYFFGTKTNLLKQIGNAVPPIVSFQIAKKIKSKLKIEKSLDLFNGAGGLMYGFKLSGIKSVLINDIDEKALLTSKINNHEPEAYLGDITEEETRTYIINKAKKEQVDIILGGPPCQGFSMAGFRSLADERNELIFDYIKILREVKPKVFLFENVPGLLSYNNGKTYEELTHLFQELGYKIEMKLLDFSDYAVPQKRKRVIIIGVLNKLKVDPVELFPEKITESENDKITTFDAIIDLEDTHEYPRKFKYNTLLNKYMTNQINIEKFLDDIKNSKYNQLSLFD